MRILLKIISTTLFALVTWELILMNFVINTTGYLEHPVLGRISREGINVLGDEGFSRTHLNSLGLREDEIPSKKGNEYRILSIGDSFTQGLQVSDDETFSSLLEVELGKIYDKEIEVINAGRPGASPANYIHHANYMNNKFEQDFTIIQISDNDFLVDLLNESREFHIIKTNNKFETNVKDNYASNNPLLQKFPYLRDFLEFSVARQGAKQVQEIFLSKSLMTNKDKKFEVDYGPVVDWTVKEIQNRYKNVVFLYLPVLNYQNLDETSEIEKLIIDSLKKNKINYISMRESYTEFYNKYYKPSHGFNNTKPGEGHINSTGHKLVNEELIKFFSGRISD
jgi:hypothetical protein